MYLFELYSQLIKKKQAQVAPFAPVNAWPKEWKNVTAKVYQRFPLLPLPTPSPKSDQDLLTAIANRHSGRVFGRSVTERALSDLLYYSLGEHLTVNLEDIPKRMYPSAGARYPLEAYVLLQKPVGQFMGGVYHYDVVAHGLRKIREESITSETVVGATAEKYLTNATGALLLTATWQRSSLKYRERTYKLTLLEAGAVFQNTALVAEALDIEAVQIGTFAEDVIETLLDIDGQQETYLHSIFFG